MIAYYQMREEDGFEESEDAIQHRIYIYLPAINHIAQQKSILSLNAFEQLCYLFKNNENGAILKSKERLVRTLMEKHERMKDDRSIWSIARAQEIGERRYHNTIKDSYEEGKLEGVAKGKTEGYCALLVQMINLKYHQDASAWLSTLTQDQLLHLSNKIFDVDSYEDLQKLID